MKLARPLFIALTAALVAATSVTWAETFSLALKRLDRQDISKADYLYWTYPQHFFLKTADGNVRMAVSQNPEQEAAFKRIVKKEPKYNTAYPLRGVAKLGEQEYAFVLDNPPLKEEPKPKAESSFAQWMGNALGTPSSPAQPLQKVPPYNRLYFDLNHNGDLTDDQPIEAETGADYSQLRFPRVDLTLDFDGTKLEYSFLLSGYVNASPQGSYVSLSLSAAACREGDITVDGKMHHIVLLDYNSNGRFDDEIKISKDIANSDDPIDSEQSDILLVDPRNTGGSSTEASDSIGRNYVSKLVNIDGRFYELKVSPAGNNLTLTPSTAAFGKVTNPHGDFHAVVYSDKGFVNISGSQESPATLPEGEWKLLSYSMTCKEPPKPHKTVEKLAAEKKTEPPKTNAIGNAVVDLPVDSDKAGAEQSGGAIAVVQAQATAGYKPITVRKNETVEMPFGPPFKPVVTILPEAPMQIVNGRPVGTPGEQQLSLSLVGSAGEVCSNMQVNGDRPSRPEFTITDSKGKIVQQGSFEYG